ncbi:hypothetical protein RCL1_007549 [Eukaryota sp. TZLM3-RCL]
MSFSSDWEEDASYFSDICDTLGYWLSCTLFPSFATDSPVTPATNEQVHTILEITIKEFLSCDTSVPRLQSLLFSHDKCRLVDILFEIVESSAPSSLRLLSFSCLRFVLDLCSSSDLSAQSSKLSFILSRCILKRDGLRKLAIIANLLSPHSSACDVVQRGNTSSPITSSRSYSETEKASAMETFAFAVCSHQVTLQSVTQSNLIAPILAYISTAEEKEIGVESFPITTNITSSMSNLTPSSTSSSVLKWCCVVISVLSTHRPSDVINDTSSLSCLISILLKRANHKVSINEEVVCHSTDALASIVAGAPLAIKNLTENFEIHLLIKELLSQETSVSVVNSVLNLLEKLLTSTGIVSIHSSDGKTCYLSANSSFIEHFITSRAWYCLSNLIDDVSFGQRCVSTLALRCIRLLVQISPPFLRFALQLVSHFTIISKMMSIIAESETLSKPINLAWTTRGVSGGSRGSLQGLPNEPFNTLRQVECALCLAWILATDQLCKQKLTQSLSPLSVFSETITRCFITSFLLLDESSLQGMLLVDVSGRRLNGLGLGELQLQSTKVSAFIVLGKLGDLIKVRTYDLANVVLSECSVVEENAVTRIDTSALVVDPNPSPYPEHDCKLTFAILLLSLVSGLTPSGTSPSEIISAVKLNKNLSEKLKGLEIKTVKSGNLSPKPHPPMKFGRFSGYSGVTTLTSPKQNIETKISPSLDGCRPKFSPISGNFSPKSSQNSSRGLKNSPKFSPKNLNIDTSSPVVSVEKQPFSPAKVVRRTLGDELENNRKNTILSIESNQIDVNLINFELENSEVLNENLVNLKSKISKSIVAARKILLLCPIVPNTKKQRENFTNYLKKSIKIDEYLGKILELIEKKSLKVLLHLIDTHNLIFSANYLKRIAKILENSELTAESLTEKLETVDLENEEDEISDQGDFQEVVNEANQNDEVVKLESDLIEEVVEEVDA